MKGTGNKKHIIPYQNSVLFSSETFFTECTINMLNSKRKQQLEKLFSVIFSVTKLEKIRIISRRRELK